jgi:hypothetical protein
LPEAALPEQVVLADDGGRKPGNPGLCPESIAVLAEAREQLVSGDGTVGIS